MEMDRLLVAASLLCLGYLGACINEATIPGQINVLLLAGASYIVVVCVVFFIFKYNAKYYEFLRKEDHDLTLSEKKAGDELSCLLLRMDAYAFWVFMYGFFATILFILFPHFG